MELGLGVVLLAVAAVALAFMARPNLELQPRIPATSGFGGQVPTISDIPMPSGYAAASGDAVVGSTSLTGAEVIAIARNAEPTAVGAAPIVRFLLINITDRGRDHSQFPAWVVLSTDAHITVLGPMNRAGPEPSLAATYGWVFMDPQGGVLGIIRIGYPAAPPPVPAA